MERMPRNRKPLQQQVRETKTGRESRARPDKGIWEGSLSEIWRR
jgi:hypothetical protein